MCDEVQKYGRVQERELISDGNGGTILKKRGTIICPECGSADAIQCMSYVWAGTKRLALLSLGYGASVKHYFTKCKQCGMSCAS